MARYFSLRNPLLLSGALCLGVLYVSACIPAGDGVEPPLTQAYFPVALAVDPGDPKDPADVGGRYLYVVNSDFDLQFNQGTVQSFDLQRILGSADSGGIARRPCSSEADCSPLGQRCDLEPTEENQGSPSHFCVDRSGDFEGLPCGPFAENTISSRAVSPGRCAPVSLEEPEDGLGTILVDVVSTSAFATDALLVPRPLEFQGRPSPEGPRARLFIPIRGDSSLHFIDVEEGRFKCGQSQLGGSCSEDYKVEKTPSKDEEEPLETPSEPYGLTSTRDGRLLIMTHQVGGKATAFINDWSVREDDASLPTRPWIAHIASSLPNNPMGVAWVPPSAYVSRGRGKPYQDGFLVTFRNDASLHLLRFFENGSTSPTEDPVPALIDVGNSLITVNTSGSDSRGIAIDDSERALAEENCGEDVDCLRAAAGIPFDVYVANRSPNSLLVGRTDRLSSPTATSDLPTFHNNIPLTVGPSRVVVGSITNARGEKEKRIFVICFDSPTIYIYNPSTRQIEAEVDTGRGPHTIVFHPDPEFPVAYVGHFTDSYISVVSLDQRHPRTYGSTLAILGQPTPPRASK